MGCPMYVKDRRSRIAHIPTVGSLSVRSTIVRCRLITPPPPQPPPQQQQQQQQQYAKAKISMKFPVPKNQKSPQ
jgi:hypothetical protein